MTEKILCVVGTRPEAIKMAPVILALQKEPWARVRVLATAQHREMLDVALAAFGISPDLDLDLMRPGQSLPDLTARLLTGLDGVLAAEKPHAVLAQGDTTTVLSAALASFYRRLPFCHVEAGLRTGDSANPFPEEMNRKLAGQIAELHFAPTESAQSNLLAEGISPERIYVTGNTGIDALLATAANNLDPGIALVPEKRLLLVTVHRRESFGAPLSAALRAIRRLAARGDVQVVFPVHPNPAVWNAVQAELAGIPDILLLPPLEYATFVAVLKRAYLVLTDSGGIQEEAPALGKPVLVLRATTERPEAVAAGVARVVGLEEDGIVAAAEALLNDETAYHAMARGVSPYGDGMAAQRIVSILKRELVTAA